MPSITSARQSFTRSMVKYIVHVHFFHSTALLALSNHIRGPTLLKIAKKMTTPTPATINMKEFTDTLARYSVTMATLSKASTDVPAGARMTPEELDFWRLNTLPQVVRSRKKPYLMKSELLTLLNCKMGRGKRRQALPKLIESNADSIINSATTAAFAYLQDSKNALLSTEHILTALKILVDPLKGVGPATASYILAVIAPDTVPAFSDEGYRWVLYKSTGKGAGGWDRKIKYDINEYRVYFDSVKALVTRLGEGVTAGDVERVGFVLGKEGADFRAESSETVTRAEGPKNSTRLNAVNAAPDIEDDIGQRTPNPALDGAMAAPAPSAIGLPGPTRLVPGVNKRKKSAAVDPYNPGVGTDNTGPPKRRKTRVPASRKGKNVG